MFKLSLRSFKFSLIFLSRKSVINYIREQKILIAEDRKGKKRQRRE